MARIEGKGSVAAMAKTVFGQYLDGRNISRDALNTLIPQWVSAGKISKITGAQKSKQGRIIYTCPDRDLKQLAKLGHANASRVCRRMAYSGQHMQ